MRVQIAPAVFFAVAMAAGNASAAGDSAKGEIAYTATCTKCHASAARLARQAKGSTTQEKQTYLESYLARHYAPDATLRADIIAFLATR